MAEIDHWHPVLRSADLGAKPRGVVLCGEELVCFRTPGGAVGALADRCPHRGMRLSRGWVERERLVCPYHGWSYDPAGNGESPGTPKLRVCADRYEALERHGAVWVRAYSVDDPPATAIPDLAYPDLYPVCVLHHVFEAPLEPVLDNFCEVEHTPTTHALLGYDLASMASVTTEVVLTDGSVRVINKGPQKPIPWFLQGIVGIYTGDRFTDDWTTFFSPVYTVYDQYWEDPRTGARRANQLKIAVFFTPRDAGTTELMTFVWTTLEPNGRYGLNRLLRPLMVQLIDREVTLDKRMVEALADKSPALRGSKLSRFDKALGENRRRLARIYRGNGASADQQ